MKRINWLTSSVLMLSLCAFTNSFSQTTKKTDTKKESTKKETVKPEPKKSEPKKADKSKFLENRKFSVQFYEIKPTGRGKAVESTVTTKTGKIESQLMKDKLELDDANFSVLLDSTYMEDETEMHLVKLEAYVENKKDETKWEATILNYDIDGTVVQKKGNVDKKKFEFSGTEKTKK